jgi:hypothetical protein
MLVVRHEQHSALEAVESVNQGLNRLQEERKKGGKNKEQKSTGKRQLSQISRHAVEQRCRQAV